MKRGNGTNKPVIERSIKLTEGDATISNFEIAYAVTEAMADKERRRKRIQAFLTGIKGIQGIKP